jgi:heterodisulfide reductase subunit A
MRHFKDDQIIAMIRSAFRGPPPTEVPHPKILAFLCNWCSYAGADMAGVSRMKYPDNVQAIRVMCSGRVDPVHVLEAFKNGADGVLVSGCHPGDCHYISGNYVAEKRVKLVRKVLEKIEIEPDRLYLGWISAAEGEKFARLITNLTKELKDKPLELTKEKIAKLEATIKALRVGKLKRIFGAMLPSDVKIDERYLPSIEKSIEAEIKRYGNLR